jgi:RNA polymerase sigma factor (sigma-70 family)
MTAETEAMWTARARARDPEAFGWLVTRHRSVALGLAQRLAGNEDAAYELVQEATLQAFLSVAQLRDDRRFRSWFLGIVLNVGRSYRRKQRCARLSLNALPLDLCAEGARPASFRPVEETVEERERQTRLREAIQALSPNNCVVTQLFYFEQWGVEEIARHLGLTPVAVKSRLHKARLELKTRLQQTSPDLWPTEPSRPVSGRRRGGKRVITVKIAKVTPESAALSVAVVLLDEAGQRGLPIWVGPYEGEAISRSLEKQPSGLAMAHDLMAKVLHVAKTQLEEVRIERLKGDSYYAVLRLRHGKMREEVNARPGDALALALQTECPILVEEEILAHAGLHIPVIAGKTPGLSELLKTWREKHFNPRSGVPWIDYPTQPLNLDFARGLEGWVKSAPGSDAPDYRMDLDSNGRRPGVPSPFLTPAIERPDGYACLMQNFRAEDYRGRRLRYSGYLKTEGVTGVACLWLRLDGPKSIRAWNHNIYPVRGTTEWTRYEYVLDVAEDSLGIAFGISLDGKGTVWVDSIAFEVVDTDVPLTSAFIGKPLEPQNLDFGEGTAGWNLQGSALSRYALAVEPEGATACGVLRSEAATPKDWGALAQAVRADSYRGRPVRLQGELRVEGTEAWGGLWLRVDGANQRVLSYVDTRNTPLQNGNDWQTLEILAEIPEESEGFTFGTLLYGNGQIRARSLRLDTPE